MRDEKRDELSAVFSGVAAAFQQMAEAWQRGMREFMESPAGQYMQAVAKWAEENPELLDAMIAAREAESRRRFCDCFCQRWDHLGSCTTDATKTVPITSEATGLVQVPMCGPCASDVRRKRVPARD